MKIWKRAFILFLLGPSLIIDVAGQNKLTESDERFTYTLYGNIEKPDNEGFLTISLVEIRDAKSKRVLQAIKPESSFENVNNHEIFQIIDINYDSYNDFILASEDGPYKDIIYNFYIFDTHAKQFVKWDKEFNDGENMINIRPVFDTDEKTITTYRHNTSTYQKTSIFKFYDGDYHLIEEHNEEPDPETDYKYLIVTVKKLIEGKIRVVSLEMISLVGED